MAALNGGATDQVLMEEKLCARILTLNRPKQLNPLSAAMVSRLLELFLAYEEDSSVKCIILKGKGRSSCSGGDVAAVAQGYNGLFHIYIFVGMRLIDFVGILMRDQMGFGTLCPLKWADEPLPDWTTLVNSFQPKFLQDNMTHLESTRATRETDLFTNKQLATSDVPEFGETSTD